MHTWDEAIKLARQRHCLFGRRLPNGVVEQYRVGEDGEVSVFATMGNQHVEGCAVVLMSDEDKGGRDWTVAAAGLDVGAQVLACDHVGIVMAVEPVVTAPERVDTLYSVRLYHNYQVVKFFKHELYRQVSLCSKPAGRGLSFREALAAAVLSDTLFTHVDCGAFTQFRWNAKTAAVEYWSGKVGGWKPTQQGDSDCEDWMSTARKVQDYPTIEYEGDESA